MFQYQIVMITHNNVLRKWAGPRLCNPKLICEGEGVENKSGTKKIILQYWKQGRRLGEVHQGGKKKGRIRKNFWYQSTCLSNTRAALHFRLVVINPEPHKPPLFPPLVITSSSAHLSASKHLLRYHGQRFNCSAAATVPSLHLGIALVSCHMGHSRLLRPAVVLLVIWFLFLCATWIFGQRGINNTQGQDK